MTGWISVKERLPNPDMPLLVHNEKFGCHYFKSFYSLGYGGCFLTDSRDVPQNVPIEVTHWMYVPDVPYWNTPDGLRWKRSKKD